MVDKNDTTKNIVAYLRRALNAAQFGLPTDEVFKLQNLVTELEHRAEGWDGS